MYFVENGSRELEDRESHGRRIQAIILVTFTRKLKIKLPIELLRVISIVGIVETSKHTYKHGPIPA
jgi:hypothetical protein